MKEVVHLGDLGIEGSAVGWILKQWAIRALATVMLFSIYTVSDCYVESNCNSSDGIAARIRLDSRKHVEIDGRGQRSVFFETSRLDRRPTHPPGAVSVEMRQPVPKCNQSASFSLVTRWCSWLRHCATSRKVAGSIFDGLNPSSCTMALW